MIKIICIGSIKEDYIKQGIKDYLTRLSKYTKVSLIELKEEKIDDEKISLQKDKEKILKVIDKKDNIVILDINSKEYTSLEFAKFINNELTYNNNITFIIGSSYGIDNTIKDLSNKRISFSKLTFPHQLFRLILLEQIYRSFKILNNEKYHK